MRAPRGSNTPCAADLRPEGVSGNMGGMEEASRRKKLLIAVFAVLVALVLPIGLLIVGGWSMWKERRAEEARFSESLQISLERAADTVLPAPTLGADAIVVECPPDDFEPQVQRVVRLARGVGGSASSWNDGESVRLIASVPQSAESLFRQAVERGFYDLVSANETKPMVVIEILITPQ